MDRNSTSIKTPHKTTKKLYIKFFFFWSPLLALVVFCLLVGTLRNREKGVSFRTRHSKV